VLTVEPNQPIPQKLSGLYRQVSINPLHLSETLSIKLHYLGVRNFTLFGRKLTKLYEVLVLHCRNEYSERKFAKCLDKVDCDCSISSNF